MRAHLTWRRTVLKMGKMTDIKEGFSGPGIGIANAKESATDMGGGPL